MNILSHPPVIEAPVTGEEQEASSTTELLLALGLGVCALAAVHLAGYAVLLITQLLRLLFDPS